jgi:hypothetical protein
MTKDLFIVRYDNCIFNEGYFLALGGEFQNNLECQEINWDDKIHDILISMYTRDWTSSSEDNKFAEYCK